MAIWNDFKKNLNKIKCKLGHYKWDLAFIDYSEDIFYKKERLGNYHLVKNPYKNKWFADPFILEVDSDNVTLLVEEFDNAVNRGRIAKLIIDRKNWTIADCKIVLDLPTHLSFPAIYRCGNNIIVHPENSASGKSIAYQYDEKTNKLIEYKLIVNQPLVDAVAYKCEENSYILSTMIQDPNGSVLQIFKQTEANEYVHLQSINIPNNCARMAGWIINAKDGHIRPAQNCDGAYGKEVIFQKIISEAGTFAFEYTGALLPPNTRYHGIHTYNSYENMVAVVDLKKYDFPIIQIIKRLIGK